MKEFKLGETAREAADLVSGSKEEEHGNALTNFTAACDIFKILTNIELKPEQGALFLACLKLGRIKTKRNHDSAADAIGYLDMYEYFNSIEENSKNS